MSYGKLTAVLLLLGVAAAAGGWWLYRQQPLKERGPYVPVRAERQEYAPVAGKLEFPEEVRQAAPEIREAYEFAARRPDLLHYMPCFCGCWRYRHRSNYDCFVDKVHADGRVDIDNMGFT